MNLLQQFQAVIGSIFIGMVFANTWYLFNRLFYHYQGKFIRLVFELPVFVLFSYLYFLFLLTICDAQLSFYYFLAILLGGYIHYRFYAVKFNAFYDRMIVYIKRRYLFAFRIQRQRIYDKIKRWKRRNSSDGKSKEQDQE